MNKKPYSSSIGRPNVGKSTFVNRLIGSRESIVDDMPELQETGCILTLTGQTGSLPL